MFVKEVALLAGRAAMTDGPPSRASG